MPLPAPIRRLRAAVSAAPGFAAATALTVVVYVAVVASRLDFVPFWDGGWYLRDLERAIYQPFALKNYVGGHFSGSFFFLYALAQQLLPATGAALHGTSLALGLVGLAGFAALLRTAYAGRAGHAERALLAAIFAFYPVHLATLFNLTPDFMAAMLYAAFLAALSAERVWLAVLLGLAATFTKEIGAVMVAYTGVCAALVFHLRHGRAPRRLAPLLIPPALYAAYIALYVYLPADSTHPKGWTNMTNEMPITVGKLVLDANWFDPMLQAYLGDIFVMSFSWLLTLPIVGLLAAGAVRWGRGRPAPARDRATADRDLFHILLLVGAVYATTRYRHWNNPRYLMIAATPLLLVSYGALTRLVRGRRARIAYLAGAGALIGASAFRTLDPASQAIWGTFRFGSHPMLLTESLNRATFTRDQLVYNLEYQGFATLFDEVAAEVAAEPEFAALIGPRNACFHFPGVVDARTGRRTLARGEGETRPAPLICGEAGLAAALAGPAARLVFVDLPATPDPELLDRMRRTLRFVSMETKARDGYELRYYRFERL